MGNQQVFGADDYRNTRTGYGMCDRQTFFFSDLSVRDNLRLMDRMNGEKGLMDEELAELLGIHEFDRIKASKLSLGNKQKLALCLAIHRETKLALLDEPLNGLDPFTKASVLFCLRKWRKQGMAVILTSHIPGIWNRSVTGYCIFKTKEIRFGYQYRRNHQRNRRQLWLFLN